MKLYQVLFNDTIYIENFVLTTEHLESICTALISSYVVNRNLTLSRHEEIFPLLAGTAADQHTSVKNSNKMRFITTCGNVSFQFKSKYQSLESKVKINFIQ